MNAIMMYMSGNSIQIFSIMITLMTLWNALNSIWGTFSAFEQFQSTPGVGKTVGWTAIKRLKHSNILLPALIFFLLQGLNLALGLWKCNGMGLLPTATSDWLAFMEPRIFLHQVAH